MISSRCPECRAPAPFDTDSGRFGAHMVRVEDPDAPDLHCAFRVLALLCAGSERRFARPESSHPAPPPPGS